MKTRKDITSLDDVKLMVDEFYSKVRADALLKDIFNDKIQDQWLEHLNKMYRFWQTVLLGEHSYHGSPFVPHAKLPVEQDHFNRWVELFCETVDMHFSGEKAERAKWQGNRMAEMFHSKIQYYKKSSARPIL